MKVFWEVSDFETLMNKISDALVKSETHLEECVSKYDAYVDLYNSKIPIIRSFYMEDPRYSSEFYKMCDASHTVRVLNRLLKNTAGAKMAEAAAIRFSEEEVSYFL